MDRLPPAHSSSDKSFSPEPPSPGTSSPREASPEFYDPGHIYATGVVVSTPPFQDAFSLIDDAGTTMDQSAGPFGGSPQHHKTRSMPGRNALQMQQHQHQHQHQQHPQYQQQKQQQHQQLQLQQRALLKRSSGGDAGAAATANVAGPDIHGNAINNNNNKNNNNNPRYPELGNWRPGPASANADLCNAFSQLSPSQPIGGVPMGYGGLDIGAGMGMGMGMGGGTGLGMGMPSSAQDQAEPGISMDLENIYAYCFDRGDGTYTRLIPADMLPTIVGIPAVQQSAQGMMILPVPHGLPPQGPLSNIQPVVVLKKKIDNIVASTPSSARKPKIYCDKWVHEGVCAFTQQGCKYKHEMPLDKATQHSLGLFHGLPAWWRKHQAELQRQQQQQHHHQQPQALLHTPDDTTTAADYSSLVISGSGISRGTSDLGQCGGAGAGAGGGRDRAMTSPSVAEPLLQPSMPPSLAWRRNDVLSKPVPMPLRPSGNKKQNQGAAFDGGLQSPAPGSPYRQLDNGSPTSPCMWGPIGPPSRMTGQNDGQGGNAYNQIAPTSYPTSELRAATDTRFQGSQYGNISMGRQ